MINTLLVCDNEDTELGNFFEKCRLETDRIFNASKHQFESIEVSGNAIFELVVPNKAKAINSNPFLFVSYSHGSESELLKRGITPFLSVDYEVGCLKNAIAYCYSCEAGRNLGKELCKNGALCFIGYSENITVQQFFGAEDAFIECAVCGIQAFIDGNTTGQMLELIKEKYTGCIDDFYSKDMLTATLFMQNRDALIIHGDSGLTISDLLTERESIIDI